MRHRTRTLASGVALLAGVWAVFGPPTWTVPHPATLTNVLLGMFVTLLAGYVLFRVTYRNPISAEIAGSTALLGVVLAAAPLLFWRSWTTLVVGDLLAGGAVAVAAGRLFADACQSVDDVRGRIGARVPGIGGLAERVPTPAADDDGGHTAG
jgi:peptidoglycan/LPS O-acetylase OafA/YrhL